MRGLDLHTSRMRMYSTIKSGMVNLIESRSSLLENHSQSQGLNLSPSGSGHTRRETKVRLTGNRLPSKMEKE